MMKASLSVLLILGSSISIFSVKIPVAMANPDILPERPKKRCLLLLNQDTLTGNWEGARTFLKEKGVEFGFVYTGEVFGNLHGGISKGATYLDNFDLILNIDAERLLKWKGASFLIYGLGTQGGSPSSLAGDLQTASNIDSPDTWKLYEAWYQQNFFDDRLSFLVGLHDLNSEFDAMETSAIFINSSHGIGPDYSQSGQNGPSIFPTSSLAARLRGLPLNYLYIQTAVFDGVPGDPNNPQGTHIQFNNGDGVLIASEIGFLPGKLKEDAPYGKFALGAWAHTSRFDDVLDVDAEGNPVRRRDNFGIYALGEYNVYREKDDPDQGLGVFGRFGYANGDVNQLQYYLGAGLKYTGLIPHRDKDQMGVAVAAAFNGGKFKQAQSNAGTPVESAEVNLEFTYRAELAPWFVLQPDFQLIINPGMNPTLNNAFLAGLRWEVSF